jgi:hypothetical protein
MPLPDVFQDIGKIVLYFNDLQLNSRSAHSKVLLPVLPTGRVEPVVCNSILPGTTARIYAGSSAFSFWGL